MHAEFMNAGYAGFVKTEIIQVRDVSAADLKVLRARAAARNMSLSRYLRELISDDASQPTMDEVLARIAGHESIEATGEEIRELIANDRR